MKTKEKKQFRELSDEELKQVNGGTLIGEASIFCTNLTLCAVQGKQLDTKTCNCY